MSPLFQQRMEKYEVRNMSNDLSDKLRTFSFLCSCMVVLIHVPRLYDPHTFSYWFSVFVSMGICKIAVPFFFVASGYFLMGHVNEPGWWKRAVKKRGASLLIPYLFWTTVGWLLVLDSQGLSPRLIVSAYGLVPWGLPLCGSLWFLRSLMVLIVLSPLLAKIANWWGVAGLFVLCGIFCPDWSSSHSKLFLSGPVSIFAMTYFVIGMTLRLKKNNIPETTGCRCLLCLGMGLALVLLRAYMSYCHRPHQCYVVWLYTPLLLIGVWFVYSRLRMRPLPVTIASCSFPLYVLHDPVLHLIRRLNIPLSSSLVPLVIFLVTVGICLSVTLGIRRFVPQLGKIVFGGR